MYNNVCNCCSFYSCIHLFVCSFGHLKIAYLQSVYIKGAYTTKLDRISQHSKVMFGEPVN